MSATPSPRASPQLRAWNVKKLRVCSGRGGLTFQIGIAATCVSIALRLCLSACLPICEIEINMQVLGRVKMKLMPIRALNTEMCSLILCKISILKGLITIFVALVIMDLLYT